MASGFFAVLDDIATLMDDVGVATKVATQKTVGILGDDLAVNAEKSTGFVSSRELPVLWQITKGSLLNKVMIVPIVFLLNVYLPIAIKIILMLGGLYLAFEGVEKIIAYLFHRNKKQHQKAPEVAPEHTLLEEQKKIKSAIKTDFILSLEIVIIALAAVLDKGLGVRIMTVSIVALLATVGVYGLVAIIVRMDDLGFKLINRSKGKGFLNRIGKLLVKTLPVVVKAFSVIGTFALLLVSGGLFLHNITFLHHWLEDMPEMLASLILGLVVGLLSFLLFVLVKRLISLSRLK